ncbi:hypothetical protein GE061_007506 [Apolygus lucorum]|uniref:Uncharacterized protein n=1 Tax=Apolygus lucorum TaxID=248454 RepID=A0A8S9WRC6_APOLU|nr:hypothetical protein GE061_007506 [Apolygus lucorum]
MDPVRLSRVPLLLEFPGEYLVLRLLGVPPYRNFRVPPYLVQSLKVFNRVPNCENISAVESLSDPAVAIVLDEENPHRPNPLFRTCVGRLTNPTTPPVQSVLRDLSKSKVLRDLSKSKPYLSHMASGP